MFNPVSENFLFTASSVSGAIVKVNGLPSVCNGDCSYSFIENPPLITSQTKDANGATIAITISDPLNSNYPTSSLTVNIDNQPCTFRSGTFSSFTCILPINQNGLSTIRAGSYNA